MDIKTLGPITVHGASISYFTGKMENYLRVKGVPYTMRSVNFPREGQRLIEETGVSQIPAVELGDGRWMTDTTKTIQWFEGQLPGNPVVPSDPVQRFVSLLIEDYADEWLWRPAMHFRWHYPAGANLLSWLIVEELVRSMPLPAPFKRWVFRTRQRGGYTRGDGITAAAVPGVEAIYTNTLAHLQAIFEKRPFILGDKPSIADVGMSGPFFRHFGLDPIPLEIMRQQAPAVFEWMARLWNTRLETCKGDWLPGVPDDLDPLLADICQHYLPYLCANVDAVAAGKKRFDVDIGDVSYKKARYSRYRVWCLQELRNQFKALPADAQTTVQQLLRKHGGWEPLWRQAELPLLPGQEQDLPFKGTYKMVGINE